MFANYSYEVIDIAGLDEFLGIDPDEPPDPRRTSPSSTPSSSAQEGRRRESRLITPSVVHNTVDNP